jgi:hypothetical protein
MKNLLTNPIKMRTNFVKVLENKEHFVKYILLC